MAERDQPNLDRVRDALRGRDDRERTEREIEESADTEPQEPEAPEDE